MSRRRVLCFLHSTWHLNLIRTAVYMIFRLHSHSFCAPIEFKSQVLLDILYKALFSHSVQPGKQYQFWSMAFILINHRCVIKAPLSYLDIADISIIIISCMSWSYNALILLKWEVLVPFTHTPCMMFNCQAAHNRWFSQ